MVIDIKLIREDAERFRAGARKKRFPERAAAVDRALAADAALREMIPAIDKLRAGQRAAAKALGGLPAEERAEHLEVQRQAKAELQALEESERRLRGELRDSLLLVPSAPHADVPDGDDDRASIEIRCVGEIANRAFALRPHHELAEAQGWLDSQRAGRVAGARNYYLLGELAWLQDAVLRFASDYLRRKGYTLADPPILVRDGAMVGTAFFPGGEEQTYRCERDALNLIGTSEVPMTALLGEEILDEVELPKRFAARSVCFRREAGAAGRDTKGLYRVHQFQKVEQVVVDVADEARSIQNHHEILANAEEIVRALELPYRVVNVASGDLGVGQVMKYDIECWMPSRGAFGETHSASRFGDYQARRLNLRYRRRGAKKAAFCHTLNNTALASPRILIPLLEIHQQPDGRVRVPDALRQYLDGRAALGRSLQ